MYRYYKHGIYESLVAGMYHNITDLGLSDLLLEQIIKANTIK